MNNLDKKLYELFARKELSEGCKIEIIENPWDWHYFYAIIEIWDNYFYARNLDRNHWDEDIYFDKKQDYKILWYEPQLHDVFRVAKERKQPLDIVLYYFDEPSLKMYDCHTYKEEDKIIKWYNPTKSLLNQSDETKSALIQLFS